MYSVVFFRTAAGGEPALDWFRTLSAEERRALGYDLRLLQIGFPLGMPLCRSLGGGLWELRSMLRDRIARVLFFLDQDTFIIVHGFIKKSQRTPAVELETARKRMKQYRTAKL